MEIKFRGFRTDGKGWIVGNLFMPNQLVRGVYICENTTYADFAPSFEEGDDINEAMLHGCALGRFIEVFPESVGMFVGITDKNGKEIYSGDIVKCLNATEPEDKGFICLFKDYRWKFNNVRYPDDDFYGTVNYKYIEQNCEVIGNLFENKELINQ